MKGLILFITAKLLMVLFYPLGYTYSITALFIKHGYYAAKDYINRSNSNRSIWMASWLFFSKGWKALDAYLFRCAIADDQHGNVYLAKAMNDTMVKPGGPKFGNPDETISSVVGKAYVSGKLRLFGVGVDKVLEKIEEDHSEKAIEYDEKH